jgi:hypothetical protein
MNRLEAIRRAMDDFDAIHGEGAAYCELVVGFVATVALLFNLTMLVVMFGGSS